MSKYSFLFFILIASLVYYGMHYYVYSQISRGLALQGNILFWLRILFYAGGLSFFAGEIISRSAGTALLKPLAHAGVLWIGVLSIAVSIFLLRNILLIFFHSPRFRYDSAAAALSLLLVISLYSVYNAAASCRIRTLEIKPAKLPPALSGFTIVQLSDLHLNYIKPEKWLRKVIDKTNALKPDLVVITGDIVDADLCKTDSFCGAFRQLKAKHGVFAVTGNHEFFSRLDKFMEAAKKSNITVLRNESMAVADSLEIAGIDDPAGGGMISANLEKALKGRGPDKPVILLSHQPDIFDAAEKYGITLQLSGHTHAGQIPFMDLLVLLYFKYPYGLYQKNSSYLYTTCGTGIWGPPMRLFSRNEIVKIVLI